jgi:hypothetical protein
MSEEVRAEVAGDYGKQHYWLRLIFPDNKTRRTDDLTETEAITLCSAINNYAELKENWNKATAELLVVKLTIVEKDAEIAKLQEKYEEVGAKFVLMGIENEDLKHKVDVTMEYLNKKE